MSASACYVIKARQESISGLRLPLSSNMQKLTQGIDQIEIDYISTLPDADRERIFAFYQKQRQKELYFGTTLYGPHRDDLQINIEKRSVKTFSSEGQKRSLIAALRLSEWQKVQTIIDAAPLFCIDDFSSYLDSSRLENLQREMDAMGQVFLTSPHLIDGLFPERQLLHIEGGKIHGGLQEIRTL